MELSAFCFPSDLYCTLEVDSFGYFVSKAKTRVFRDTTEPQWNEVSHHNNIFTVRCLFFDTHHKAHHPPTLCVITGV